jgi:hypothetical protein
MDLNLTRELRAACEDGLRAQYGEPLGSLLADVLNYGTGSKLDLNRLRSSLEDEATAIVAGIVGNRADAPLMLLIRGQMIGRALVHDREAVIRWATEGQNRAPRVGGPWADTLAQWQWVRENPDRYILYARQLKLLFNQI